MVEDQQGDTGDRRRDERRRDERRRPAGGEENDDREGDDTLGMGDTAGKGGDGLPGPLLDVVSDPAEGRHRLPYLLGLLDSDDPHVRLTAGTAVCLVAESIPALQESVVRRLVDRVDDDAPPEVAHALGYLATRDPETVDEVVSRLADESERQVRDRLSRHGTGFVRSEYLAPIGGNRRVGRARLASGSGTDDPRRVYASEAEADPLEDEDDREDEDAGEDADGDGEDEDETVEDGDGVEDDTDTADATGSRFDRSRRVTSGTLAVVSRRLSEVVDASEFDELTLLSERRRGRYGDVYRAVGTHDGDEYAVALTVHRLPDENRDAYAAGFRDAMDAWCDVHDHRAILSVYDWGIRPRPWAAIDYADTTLATREDDPPPLGTALELAGAVAYAHQRGVVHGAIDPGNVAYLDTALTEGARRQPMLTNVGLAVETGFDRPGVGVDPRYAAPEHYDDSYGRVDHATDVYGLGALVYRLCTGRHPYDEVPQRVDGNDADADVDDDGADANADGADADAVRERVLSASFPEPTSVNPNLPRAVDQVVAKATATRKLKRYETVTQFERELRSLARQGTSGGAN